MPAPDGQGAEHRSTTGFRPPPARLGTQVLLGDRMRLLAVAALVLTVPLAACALPSSAPAPTPNAGTQTPPTVRPAPAPTRAPLVASGCEQRIVRQGGSGAANEDGDQGAERRRSVAFHNRCDFPVRVLYAVRSDGRLTELTEMLGVGETSNFTRIEDGYDRPGYVVCSYGSVPASYPCRLGRGK
jgi:hypothetical protein